MEHPVHLGVVPTLHIHANGALTFCGAFEEPDSWEDTPVVLTLAA